MAQTTAIGIIGCGNISGIYCENARTLPGLTLVACADLDAARAQAQAEKYGIRASTVEELLRDPSIELVINLTLPKTHAEVALAVLEAGKSVYNEKPLAVTRADAQQMLKLAQAKGLRVGAAPDTFLGGGLQTCRTLIDQGAIGRPVAAIAHLLYRGMEHWHPNPAFFYQPGAGPLFDIGPYYLTALTALLGAVQSVSGTTRITHAERLITSQPLAGQLITVTTPTHVAATLEHVSGVISSLVLSFDISVGNGQSLTIYGSEGTLELPDPNTFGGPVRLLRRGAEQWEEMALTHGYTANSRGLGVADMAAALREGRPHRASGELAYHVLDTMQAIYDSADERRHIALESTCQRPEPLPARWPEQEESTP